MAEEKKNIPKLRFREFTGDNANAWELRKLGDIVKWKKGRKLTKAVINECGKGNEVIHYADLYKFAPVIENGIHWSVSEEGTLIPKNSLLFPMSDVTPGGLARTTTITKNNVRAGGDILIGTIKNGISAQFLSYYINLYYRDIIPLVTGTTVRHINSNDLNSLNTIIPNEKEQKYVKNYFNIIENLITLHQCRYTN